MNEKEIKSLLQRYYKEQHALKVKNRLQEYYNIKLKENSLASFDEIIGEEKLDQLSVNDSEVKKHILYLQILDDILPLYHVHRLLPVKE